MPGPNSAPNGDRGLVRGDKHERFIEQTRTVEKDGKQVKETYYVPAREHDAKRGRLNTGKTAKRKA